jgi:hypothetical protein
MAGKAQDLEVLFPVVASLQHGQNVMDLQHALRA